MRKILLYAVLVLLVPGGIPAAAALYAWERIGRRRKRAMRPSKKPYVTPVSALKDMPEDMTLKITHNPQTENQCRNMHQ